jgi:hypothetical protein
MQKSSSMTEKQRCTICLHPARAAIDQLLASGGASQRAIANRFHIGRNALARHHERHVLQAVRNQILQRQDRRERALADVWSERLDDAYTSARRRFTETESDPKRWAAGVGYLGALNKSIELGLKACGQIEGGRGTTHVTVEHLVVLPHAAIPTTVVPAARNGHRAEAASRSG